jgi:hypothetical protein
VVDCCVADTLFCHPILVPRFVADSPSGFACCHPVNLNIVSRSSNRFENKNHDEAAVVLGNYNAVNGEVHNHVNPPVSIDSLAIPSCRIDYWMAVWEEAKRYRRINNFSVLHGVFFKVRGKRKTKVIMWPVIVDKIVTFLSKAQFVTKEEALGQQKS